MVYNRRMSKLSDYLDRIMRQKNLTAKEMARRCNLTDSYIGRMRKGEHGDIGVNTIVELSKGLDVDAHEVFAGATGIPVSETSGIDAASILDLAGKVINNPASFDLLRQVVNMQPEHIQVLLGYLGHLNAPQGKGKGKSPKKGKPHKK